VALCITVAPALAVLLLSFFCFFRAPLLGAISLFSKAGIAFASLCSTSSDEGYMLVKLAPMADGLEQMIFSKGRV
jgi:hypothetical protein